MKYTFGILACFLLLTACKTDKKDSPETNTEATNKYTISPFAASTEYADAQIKSFSYEKGVFDFKLGDGEYQLGQQTPDAKSKMCANSGKGQHIHLIVDNGPYAAKYTANFEHDLEDGEHYLLAFLSRSYHESIKTEDAYTAQKIMVEGKSMKSSTDIKSPMLFYSRPKGTYVGDDTKKVMLDFYMANASMENYQVKASINGEDHIMDTWQPYYIEGLPFGENTIELSLLDKDGKLVDTPLNPVSRSFNLKEANELEK